MLLLWITYTSNLQSSFEMQPYLSTEGERGIFFGTWDFLKESPEFKIVHTNMSKPKQYLLKGK